MVSWDHQVCVCMSVQALQDVYLTAISNVIAVFKVVEKQHFLIF